MIRRTFLKLMGAAVAVAFAPAVVIAQEQQQYKFDIDAWLKWLLEDMESSWNEALDKILLKGNGAEPPEVEINASEWLYAAGRKDQTVHISSDTLNILNLWEQ